MADAGFGALQTADAIAGLITTVVRVYNYCQELRRVHILAQLVLDRIEGLDEILTATKQICERRGFLSGAAQDEEAAGYDRHIIQACGRCERAIQRVETKLGSFAQASGSTPTLWDRRNLLRARPDIHADLENLAAHKHTLALWLNLVTLDGLSNTQATSACHEIRSKIPESITLEVNLKSLLEQRSLVSARKSLVEGSRLPTSLPIDITDRPSQIFEQQDDTEETVSTEDALDDLKSVRETAQELLRRRDAREILPGQDEHALTHHIQAYWTRGRECLRTSQYAEAERDFSMALAYAERRNSEYQSPLVDPNLLLEQLAQAYQGLKEWRLAIDIVEGKILHVDDHGLDAASLSNRKVTARRYEMLGALYLGQYYEANDDFDRSCAHMHTQRAYHIWKSIEAETSTLAEDDFKHFRSCSLQLSNMLRSKNSIIEAEYYEQQLAERTPVARGSIAPGPALTIASDTVSIFSADSSVLHRLASGQISSVGAFDEAVRHKDSGQLQKLYTSPAFDWPSRVNECNDRHETALHFAAENGHPPTLQFLLEHGADIDATDDQHRTPLFRALHKRRFRNFELLLQWENGKANTRTIHDGGTLLHEAVKSSTTLYAERLLQKDPDLLNLANRCGQTALHICAERASLERASLEHVRYLITAGADVNAQDAAQRTPLHMALSADDQAHESVFRELHAASASTGIQALERKESQRQKRWLDERRATARRQSSIRSMSTPVSETKPRPQPLKGHGQRRTVMQKLFS